MRRKVDSRIMQSAGTTEPGGRWMMSPGTRSISATGWTSDACVLPVTTSTLGGRRRRRTGLLTDDCRRKTLTLLRYSCQKRTPTETEIMIHMTTKPAYVPHHVSH